MNFELTEEQKDVVRAAKEFAESEFPDKAQEFDQDESFDEESYRKAAGLGFVGVFIEEKYDGPGMGIVESCLITEEFTADAPGIAMAVLSSCFGAEVVQAFGSEEQRKTYLSPLVMGEAIMGIALTEPDAGSDLAAASTAAIKEGDEYIINGSKGFTTDGSRANYLVCLVVTDPDSPEGDLRHSLILVETDRDGFEANLITGKLGDRGDG
jgi:alkylation response protein AidB-like acyl-CoA dehydrogenase